MRRLLVIGLVLVVGALALAVGSCGGGGAYKVRAIFDDASFVVPGEDVKIAGVRVGSIDSMSVTPERKAAVVLNIEMDAYQDFREDATCKIRPQSLIGEQYVECAPTQGRAETSDQAPALQRIEDGPGKGQYLLPVENTSVSVALDLVGSINQLPVRQRLTLILNELGVGLAGRGEDLNEVIRRSAPALQEVSKVVQLVASQNRQLKQLAVDSDTIMQPLAERREDVTGFVRESERVARATAERREALAAGLQRFPTFLEETTPTMRRLTGLADELQPIAEDLRAQAPAINQVIRRTGPFARSGTPALLSLGEAAEPGIPAIRGALPIARDLRSFAVQLRPVAKLLADVLVSVRNNEGLERIMDYAYFQAQAVNGFDSVSHFLRAGLIVNTCSTYAVRPTGGCSSKFSDSSASAASAASSMTRDPALLRTEAVLAGRSVEDVLADPALADDPEEADEPATRRSTSRSRSGGGDDEPAGRSGSARPSRPAATPTATATPGATAAPSATATAPPASSSATPAPDPTTQAGVLDFLFGEDG